MKIKNRVLRKGNEMDNYRRIAFSMVILLTGLVTSQCILPATENDITSGLSAELYRPVQGAVYSLGESVHLEGLVGDYETYSWSPTYRPGGPARFYANGLPIGDLPLDLAGYSTIYALFDWTPEESGEYQVQMSYTYQGELAISAPRRICVIDFSLESPELRDLGPYVGPDGYEGDCEIPARRPDATPGEITVEARVSPSRLKYFPGWWDPIDSRYEDSGIDPPAVCRDLPTSLRFVVSVVDHNGDVAFVKVDVIFRGHPVVSHTLVLNPFSLGSDTFLKTYDGVMSQPTSVYRAESLNESFEVEWTVYAIGRSGESLAQYGPNVIPVDPCIREDWDTFGAPAPEQPAEPPPLEPSEANCPPGTYYAPVTNRCIAIQIPEGGSDGRGGKGGGCNLSVTKCSKQGLSFDGNNCQCVPIQ